MSVRKFAAAVESAGLKESETKWFPRWLERYAKWTGQLDVVTIEIRVEPLLQLLRSLRDSGKKAFTRLQLVRSLEFYQKSVSGTSEPDLSPFRGTIKVSGTNGVVHGNLRDFRECSDSRVKYFSGHSH